MDNDHSYKSALLADPKAWRGGGLGERGSMTARTYNAVWVSTQGGSESGGKDP